MVLVAAWLPVPVLLCSRPRPFRGAEAVLAAGVVVVGIVLLAVTIRADLGAWWLVPVALLLGVQLAGLRLLWTRRGTAAGEEGTGRAGDGSPPRRGHGQVTYRVDREL